VGLLERAILVIVLLVAVVGVVGLFSTHDFGPTNTLNAGLTGNVVAQGNSVQGGTLGVLDCASCSGYAPVCAKMNNRYITFNNRCEAVCDGARIVRTFPCEQI